MSRVVIPEEVEGVWRLSFEESTSDLLPPSLRRVYLKISPQRFDLASLQDFARKLMQCADEDGRYAKTVRRRKIVPGVSFLTTCDELREARSEIKRVPEISRGSARSNYLREARGMRTDCGVDIFFLRFSFISPSDQLSPSHFLCRVCRAMRMRDGQPKGWKGMSKENYFGLLFCA